MASATKKSTAKHTATATITAPTKPVRQKTAPQQPAPALVVPATKPSLWKPWYSWALLTLLVLAALVPVSGRAFNIDDTLFLRAGQNIAQQPLNPYGFQVNWDGHTTGMSNVTKNPPLACYYIALVGVIAGWSERPLHLAFLLPAVAVVLLTFSLARRMTQSPLSAALIAIAAPGFLVSAASVMCDVTMTAVWLLSIVLWLEGSDKGKPWALASSAVLMGIAGLTKYFGVALIPLLLAYTLYRERRAGRWLLYFLIPAVMLTGYQLWTASLYGRGLLLDAAGFASQANQGTSFLSQTIEGLSFLGGCMLPGLIFAPWLWSRLQLLAGVFAGAAATFLIATGVIMTGPPQPQKVFIGVQAFHNHPILFSIELTLFIAGGISILALSITDFVREKDSKSLLLLLWVLGTFAFTSYFNWTVNARSILPLIPAAAILITRRLTVNVPARSPAPAFSTSMTTSARFLAPLAVSALIAVWVLVGDTQLGNSSRNTARMVEDLMGTHSERVWFAGHWGFQYYMEEWGAKPLDAFNRQPSPGDDVVVPENNTGSTVYVNSSVSGQLIQVPLESWSVTMSTKVGAGFYSAYWGPLPFFLGPVPTEQYSLMHLEKRE